MNAEFNLKFNDVYVISERIIRHDLNAYFWPSEQKNLLRESAFGANKKEGWLCNFLENGLSLDVEILISKFDYMDWPKSHRTQNTNTIKSELVFHEQIEYKLSEPVLKIKHLARDAENIRKKIYVSNRFGKNAHHIWAAQYFAPDFEPAANRDYMFYALGFNRSISNDDQTILSEIMKDLSGLAV